METPIRLFDPIFSFSPHLFVTVDEVDEKPPFSGQSYFSESSITHRSNGFCRENTPTGKP